MAVVFAGAMDNSEIEQLLTRYPSCDHDGSLKLRSHVRLAWSVNTVKCRHVR